MNKDIEIYLCSFASPDLNKSVSRFKDQAKKMNIYREIKVYGFDDLSDNKKKQIEKFRSNNQNRIFGYACWKSEIILDCLNSIPEKAVLQYSDIGCHLNVNGLKRLKEYYILTKENNVLGFQYKKPNFKDHNLKYQIYYEKEYSKGDLINFLDLDLKDKLIQTEQFWSGTVFFKNNEDSKLFLREWNKICNINHLIDDSESTIKNHDDFIEHRHDQSIFSLLCKLNNVYSLSASEAEWAEDKNDKTWEHLGFFPIIAKRDKRYNLFKRFINRQKKNIRRILKKWSV